MRVLHVVPAYAPNIGGIEVLLSYLLPAMHATHGVQSAVCVGSPNVWTKEFHHFGVTREIEHGVLVARFGRSEPAGRSELTKILTINSALRSVFVDFQPDVVHIHGPSRLANGAHRIASAAEIPVVLHVHGEIAVPGSFERLCRETETVIVPSQFLERMLCQQIGRSKTTLVIPNGLSPEAFALPHSVHRSGDLRLLAAGRLEHNKGFDVGIRAVAMLRNRGLPVSLTLVGEGTEKDALSDLVHFLGARSFIEIHPPISHGELLVKMSNADAVIVPSRELEGFGLVAAEASALGIPCVVCATGGLPEVVIQDRTGWVVPPDDYGALADAIANVFENEAARSEKVTSAREYAKTRFSLGVMCDQLFETYSHLNSSVAP